MIFELHQWHENTVIVFEDSDTCWECLYMLDAAFHEHTSREQRDYHIVCFSQYDNGIMFVN